MLRGVFCLYTWDMNVVLEGDALAVLKTLDSESVQTCVTSPPYFGLRDYGHKGQIGLEKTPDAYVAKLVELFSEVKRTLRDDGTLWLNLGDSYWSTTATQGRNEDKSVGNIGGTKKLIAGGSRTYKREASSLKTKDLIGIPWRVALALQADGWYLRQDIIWSKTNPMPESVTDRCTKAHEYIFLLSKSPTYYYDHEAVKEPAANPNSGKSWDDRKANGEPMRHGLQSAAFHKAGGFSTNDKRNRRSVWTVSTKPYKGAHFATFPPDLITPCILAGAPLNGTVLDPFLGSGTTAAVAKKLGRQYVGIELNSEYVKLSKERLASIDPTLFDTNASSSSIGFVGP